LEKKAGGEYQSKQGSTKALNNNETWSSEATRGREVPRRAREQ